MRLLGEAVTNSPEMAEAAELASIAARGIPGVEGRPLYAGYAGVEWPDAPHLAFWHALTLLREYRGDGHVAALQTAGLERTRSADHAHRDRVRLPEEVRA